MALLPNPIATEALQGEQTSLTICAGWRLLFFVIPALGSSIHIKPLAARSELLHTQNAQIADMIVAYFVL